MSDNRKVYRRIKRGLKQMYPKQLTGHQAIHLNTLAGMVAGIVQSKHSHLEKIARKIPEKTQVESRVMNLRRFIANEKITAEIFFLPFITALIAALAESGGLTIAMDGSVTGNGCITLMVSVIYRKRAVPIAWITVKGKKGHLPEETHLALLAKVEPLFPKECHVVFLGDGEFDGVGLQQAIIDANWEYVCRTAKNRIIIDDGDEFALHELHLTPGESIDMPDVGFTRADFGPVSVIAWWQEEYEDPIYLVTNMECLVEAVNWYRFRFRIETFFSDQKSRGFNLHKSRLSNPDRIARFLFASCLAYIWMLNLGVTARKKPDIMRQIHRADRCDLSLFQIGLRYLEHLLNSDLPLPFCLILPP